MKYKLIEEDGTRWIARPHNGGDVGDMRDIVDELNNLLQERNKLEVALNAALSGEDREGLGEKTLTKRHNWRLTKLSEDGLITTNYSSNCGPVDVTHVVTAPSVKEWLAGDILVDIAPSHPRHLIESAAMAGLRRWQQDVERLISGEDLDPTSATPLLVLEARLTGLKLLAEEAQERVASWETKISEVMPADFKDWWQNDKSEWPLVTQLVIRSLKDREELAWKMLEQKNGND